MARPKKNETHIETEGGVGAQRADPDKVVSLSQYFSKQKDVVAFKFWIIGITPLISHAWSEKARREMLGKQVKAVKAGKEERNPHADFVNSQYSMPDDRLGRKCYGFPAMGVKNSLLAGAHKDKGIARTAAMSAIWIDAELVSVRPAMAGAVCDMPLLQIFGPEPEMREDMVKIGSGLQKIANLAYRSQHKNWAMRVCGTLNTSVLTLEQLAFLVTESGSSSGMGEWRTERRGVFGAYRLATTDEEKLWDAYAGGKGPLPIVKAAAMPDFNAAFLAAAE